MIKQVNEVASWQETKGLRNAIKLSLVLVMGFLTLVGCKKDDVQTTVAVSEVKFSETTLSLVAGSEKTIAVSILPENATDKSIAWTSSQTEVAQVENGKITARKAGKTTITAKSTNGKTAKCEVTVTPKVIEVSEISLTKTTLTLTEGTFEKLAVTILPADATDKNLTWTSSNTEVATVQNGIVTALKAGTATITAQSSNGKAAKCELTVNQKVINVEGIILTESEVVLKKGGTKDLLAILVPENATNKNITWSSNKTSVATVTNGRITAVGAGEAVITATTEDGKHSTSCKVTVKEDTPKFQFSKDVAITLNGEDILASEQVISNNNSLTVLLTNVKAEDANKVRWIVEGDEGIISIKKDAANPLLVTITGLQAGEVSVVIADETYDENSQYNDNTLSFIVIVE
ncbi:Ig-like domain-containing protein [Capnocytophaga sp.]|uniref:Ig-like domain-containing protein n=1 Tax=Capnocytophaga sp. TaxID=44737 RepID=UPI0026DCAA2B|nr:Ig-like domain-containing protein [Capnocytophaga sp.]MDO5105006.1 Ig-like domain-containing protein [Capnocytophaga sp.]